MKKDKLIIILLLILTIISASLGFVGYLNNKINNNATNENTNNDKNNKLDFLFDNDDYTNVNYELSKTELTNEKLITDYNNENQYFYFIRNSKTDEYLKLTLSLKDENYYIINTEKFKNYDSILKNLNFENLNLNIDINKNLELEGEIYNFEHNLNPSESEPIIIIFIENNEQYLREDYVSVKLDNNNLICENISDNSISKLNNINKVYIQNMDCIGANIYALNNEGKIFFSSECHEFEEFSTNNLKYNNISELRLYYGGTCGYNYIILGEDLNKKTYIVNKGIEFNYVMCLDDMCIRADRTIELNGKLFNKKYKMSLEGVIDKGYYFITTDDYLYDISGELINSSKVKSIYKYENYNSDNDDFMYIIIFNNNDYISIDEY